MKDIIPIKDIEEQINKIFGSLNSCYSTKVSFILFHLDLSSITEKIKIRRTFYRIEALLKLYLYKKIKSIRTYNNLFEILFQDKKEAYNLGFFKDNNRLILPNKRTINKFFQRRINGSLLITLDTIVEKILARATKQGILLDIEVVKKVIKRKKKDHRKEMHEAVKLIKKLIYPQIEIKMRHNARFSTRDLLDILVHIAQNNDFCNNGTVTYKEIYPDKDVPHGNTMLYHLRKLNNVDEIRKIYRKIFDIIFRFARKNYCLMRRRKLDIAVDIHNIPYYGDKNDSFVKASKHERGTSYFLQFLTCSIVVSGKRFTIDVIPIHPLDDIKNLMEELIINVKRKVNINYCYLDRYFDKGKIISLLNKYRVKFVMPKVRTKNVKQYMDKYEECKAKVVNGFEIGKEKAKCNLILVDDEFGLKRCFITNFHIPEQLTHYLYTFYSRRWGIETGYRNLEKDFKPRTTSKNFTLRLFYFLFSVCLYNLWVLTNLCIGLVIYGRVPEKPIITAKLFCILLHRVQVEYVDPGG